ncbi:gamma-glutamyltransferase [Ferrimonas balearica]|uniref:gamma-glutamyltransferase n=1 Tax=Ferrimonas balearica TaxID=44012 RepID=UPI001C990144|nr:gamma-glutamyltransferase [Ferrimonas balearica]MBY5921690.1 gamma-glutamyltransferase [Ferrimonas balearica]MBY5994970.1 gamma-glutamyltransferase [Ferrimonas balearica]
MLARRLLTLILLLITLPASAGQGAIAAPDRYGAETGAAILAQGGNAVDAAVATAFTLAVTYPEAGNLGGGGFMTLWFEGHPYFLDYRETAPALAHRDLYLDEQGEVIPDLSLVGSKAVGVPGSVMGMWEAHQRFGQLPWAQLLAPAIQLAEQGFVPGEALYQIKQDGLSHFGERTNFARYFGSMEADKPFRQLQLAATLKRIATQGPDDFYQGTTAELLVEQMGHSGGLISLEDLVNYRAKWRQPIQFPWQGFTLVTAPPPSSGGIALAQLLALKAERLKDFAGLSANEAQYVHLVAEIEKRVFADRAEYLGDPDFHPVPVERLLDPQYLAKRAQEVKPNSLSPTLSVQPGLESHQTTHYSVVDAWGNAVSNTTTLNLEFGSGVVVEGAGFLLNNEMDDFSAKPGVPNAFGVVGGDANAIAPGKRMLSSMSPSLLVKDKTVELVIGTPGGSTIFTSVFQVISNLYDLGMTPEQAVALPRFHHQLWPANEIRQEPYGSLAPEDQKQLERMGYKLVVQDWDLGDVQVLQRQENGWQGAADPRGRGTVILVETEFNE